MKLTLEDKNNLEIQSNLIAKSIFILLISLIVFIISNLIITSISFSFNHPLSFIRLIFAIIYLLFLPGFIFYNIFINEFNSLSYLEKCLLICAVSISLPTITGFILNFLNYPLNFELCRDYLNLELITLFIINSIKICYSIVIFYRNK